MKEFTTKAWMKTTLNYFFKYLKEQLQPRLSAVWSGVQQTAVDEVTDRWRWHIWACVHAKGCHFEHLL